MRADSEEDNGQPAREQLELAVETFRMLADVTRLQLLWALRDREMAVNDLAAVVGRPSAAVSQHLAKMRLARLVSTRRDGTRVFYRLDNSHVRQLVGDAVYNAEHAGTDVPAHHRADPSLATLTRTRDTAVEA